LTRNPTKSGRIEVIAGGMFSGKSEELVRRLRRASIARQKVQVFKPVTDDRHQPDRLVTRDLRELEAETVRDSAALRAALARDVEVVGVDEAQFFDEGLAELAMELADAGVRVVVAGLDQDFARRPFGPMPRLLAQAEMVDKMHAVCVRCGEPAHYSQRIAGGSDPRLLRSLGRVRPEGQPPSELAEGAGSAGRSVDAERASSRKVASAKPRIAWPSQSTTGTASDPPVSASCSRRAPGSFSTSLSR
jgi:thymidine kinase